ncbi:MAG TPA: hypothetical protein PKJ26_05305 [Candidatus Woesebacteria bacterium]|nr:hypothetical protein [Candidatus Woesebacteria bacterium]HNS65882.1 hypothetical protein [Candidatus Woesebacteria bacterium]
MLETFQLKGIGRSMVQLLFVGTMLIEFYTIFLLVQSGGRDYFLFIMIFVFGLILKYLQGYLVYRIQVDVKNKSIVLNRSFGEVSIVSKDVKEWGYRIIVTEAEYISRTKNLEIYLNNGQKIIYPFNLFGTKPTDEFKQALIDCLGSTPKTYSMKSLTFQSDVLFVLL